MPLKESRTSFIIFSQMNWRRATNLFVWTNNKSWNSQNFLNNFVVVQKLSRKLHLPCKVNMQRTETGSLRNYLALIIPTSVRWRGCQNVRKLFVLSDWLFTFSSSERGISSSQRLFLRDSLKCLFECKICPKLQIILFRVFQIAVAAAWIQVDPTSRPRAWTELVPMTWMKGESPYSCLRVGAFPKNPRKIFSQESLNFCSKRRSQEFS